MFLKKIAVLSLIFTNISFSLFAVTYIWTGNSGDGKWTTAGNWFNNDSGISASDYPGQNSDTDKVYIRENATISLDSSVTIDGLSLGSNGQSSDFTITINASPSTNTLTVKATSAFSENGADYGIVTYRPTSTNDTSKVSNLILNCNVVSENMAIHSGGNVTIGSGYSAKITNVANMAGSANTPTLITVNGTLISENISLAGYDNQTITNNGTISTNKISGNNNTVTNNGTLVVTDSDNSSTSAISGSGQTFLLKTGNSSYAWLGITTDWNNSSNWSKGSVPDDTTCSVLITNTTNQPEISTADVNVGSIYFSNGSVLKISSNKTFTVNSDYSLSNIDTSSSGTVACTGAFTIDTAFSDSDLSFQTTGTSAFTVNASLTCKNITTSGNLDISTATTCAEIACSGKFSAAADVSCSSFSCASLNSSAALTTTSTTTASSVSGTAEFSGTADQIITFGKEITLSGLKITKTGGNLDFAGSTLTFGGTSIDSSASNYTLTFDSSFALSALTMLTKAATVTTKSTSTINKNLIIMNDYNNQGTVTFDTNPSISGTVTNSGTINFNGTNTASLSGNVTNTGTINISGDYPYFQSNLKDSGTITGTVTFTGVTAQTFTPSALTYTKIVENKSGGTLTVSGNLSATDFTLTNGTTTSFSGTASFQTCTITDSGTTKFASTATIQALNITKSSEITFSGNATITTYSDTANGGSIKFLQGGSISTLTGSAFNTTGSVQFGDASSDSFSFGTQSVTHTAGATTLYGKVTASSATFSSVVLGSNATLDCSSVTFNGSSTESSPETLDSSSSVTLTVNGNMETTGYFTLGASKALTIKLNPETNTFTNSGNLTIPHSSKITGNFTNKKDLILYSGTSISVSGTFDDSAAASTLSGTGITDNTAVILLNSDSDQSFIAHANQSYPDVQVELTDSSKTLTFTNQLSIAKLEQKSGNIVFSSGAVATVSEYALTSGNMTFNDEVSIASYSETTTSPSSALTFNKKATFSNASGTTFGVAGNLSFGDEAIFAGTTAFNNSGNVTFAGAATVSADLAFNNSGSLILGTSGKLSCTGALTVNRPLVSNSTASGNTISAASVQTAAITTTAATPDLTIAVSSGTISTGQIGESAKKFGTVTIDSSSGTSDLSFGTSSQTLSVYANELVLKSGAKITVQKLSLSNKLTLNSAGDLSVSSITSGDELKLSSSAIIFIENTSAVSLIFDSAALPSSIILNGSIEVAGSGGLNLPQKPVTLLGNTTLVTSYASGAPVSLFDYVSGTDYTLTISNSGDFTLYEASDVSANPDPADIFTTPASFVSVKTFTQNGNGENHLAGDISASGNITFEKNIILSDNVKLSASSSNTVIFADGVEISGTGSVFVDGTLQTGNLTLNANLYANNNVTTSGNFTGSSSLIFTGTNNQTLTTNNHSFEKVEENKSGGTFTVSGDISATDFTLTKGTTTSFSGTASFQTCTITDSGTTKFASTATIQALNITKSSEITFSGNATITTFTDTESSGIYNFSGAATTFKSDTTFATTSAVHFGSSASASGSGSATVLTVNDGTSSKDITHTAGDTTLYGTVKASKATFAALNLYENTVFDSDFALKGDAVSKTEDNSAFSNILVTGDFSISDGKSVSAKAITFEKSVKLEKTAYLNADLYFASSTPAVIGPEASPLDSSAVLYAGESSENISRNLIIAKSAEASALSVNMPVVCSNFVLYSGTLKMNSNLSSQKDVILLGSAYNENDTETGSSSVFAYAPQDKDGNSFRQTQSWSSSNYNSGNFETAFPGTLSSYSSRTSLNWPVSGTAFKGSVTFNESSADSSVKAGKNFYANGITLSASSVWNLYVPDLTDASKGFAEAYYCSVQNSSVICYEDNSSDGSKAVICAEQCTDNSGNSNWDFTDFEITKAFTVRDNVVRVEFNKPVRNINQTYSSGLLKYSEGTFVSAYSDADCTSLISGNCTAKDASSGNYYLYLKSSGSWNTDATGKSSGTNLSTDRNGNHQSSLPYLDFPKDLSGNPFVLTTIFGKRLKNYSEQTSTKSYAFGSSTDSSHEVFDKTGPVLISVATGQEKHSELDAAIGSESQHSFDSHNFIKFTYSEKVNFGDRSDVLNVSQNDFDNTDLTKKIWLPAAAILTENAVNVENVRVNQTFGALESSISQSGNLILKGLGQIDYGKLHTGSSGNDDKYVNALYREDSYSIKLSAAGFTSGTVTDTASAVYKNWTGYLEDAQTPSGSVKIWNSGINTLVTDCAALENGTALYNPQEIYSANQVNPVIDNSKVWDTSSPVFAPLRMSGTKEWGSIQNYEAIGNTNGAGSTIERIEFHLLDNTPTYTSSDESWWLSEKGWVKPVLTDNPDLYTSDSYCADIFGGSRPFDSSDKTSGGIRYSTIVNAASSFTYSTSDESGTGNSFNNSQKTYSGASALVFTGSDTTRRSTPLYDSLYFGLSLSDLSLPINTTFYIHYDETKSFITDLAGNRLRSKTISTIDRTPPSFNITLSPVNKNELIIVFVKSVITDSSKIKLTSLSGDAVNISDDFYNLIPQAFELFSLDSDGKAVVSSDLQIDYSSKAEKIEKFSTEKFTGIKLKLTGNVTLSDVENLYLRLKAVPGYSGTYRDPLTNLPSLVSFIQDEVGNCMQINSAHSLSDFAINAFKTQYAYESEMTSNGEAASENLYQNGSWAVHDFSRTQANYGTLIQNKEISIVTEKAPHNLRLFISENPDSKAISAKINSDFATDFRIWLPDVPNGIFTALSYQNNSDFFTVDGTDSLITIRQEDAAKWKSGSQLSFLYGFLDSSAALVSIYNSPYYDASLDSYNLSRSTKVPLFALRLEDSSDSTSLDLWSFKLQSFTEQRGGVTILNNAINVSDGEKTVIKVTNPKEGPVNVVVMTMDGNVVQYLNHGNLSQGEHYFYWNGKNKAGNSVSRGIYFVRVFGNDFDETRKVLVTK